MTVRSPRLLRTLVLSAVVLVAACSSDTTDNRPTGSSSTPTGRAEPSTSPSAPGSPATPISIRIGDKLIRASLNDSPAARALRDQLPLTVDLRDYNSVEKTGKIAALPMDDMPDGSGATAGTLGYYAPDQVLVLYYRDVSYFPGIAVLGEFDDQDGAVGPDTPDITATLRQDR